MKKTICILAIIFAAAMTAMLSLTFMVLLPAPKKLQTASCPPADINAIALLADEQLKIDMAATTYAVVYRSVSIDTQEDNIFTVSYSVDCTETDGTAQYDKRIYRIAYDNATGLCTFLTPLSDG